MNSCFWNRALVALSLGGALTASAKDIWVDCANYGKSGLTGESKALAFGTIQDAVNAAVTDDVIKVEPGVYDKGGVNDSAKTGRSRVYVYGKKLTIVATSPDRSATHIVGKWDSNPDAEIGHGLGLTDQYRCVTVRQAVGTVIRGFTLRDGATRSTTTGDATSASGGALLALGASDGWAVDSACLVDCDIMHCSGIRGGGMRGGTAVRCRFTDNYAYNSGAAGRVVALVNCVVYRNYDRNGYLLYETSKAIGCTFVNNYGLPSYGPVLYNCVSMNNTKSGEENVVDCEVHNFVTRFDGSNPKYRAASELDTCWTNAPRYQFIAPLYDDFRVKKGAESETAGDAKWLAPGEVVTLPAGIDPYLDVDGNVIPKTGTICAGAVQTVVTPSAGAVEISERNTVLADGKACLGKQLYAFASDAYPTQFVFQAVNRGNPHVFDFLTDGGSTNLFPTLDDRAALMPYADVASVRTVSVKNPTRRLFVDPVNGVDSPRTDLTDDDPYQTLQAAADAVKSFGTVIEVAAGDYKTGGTTGGGTATRLVCYNGVRIVGKGADKSVIWGEAPATSGGIGTRCVVLGGANVTAALQGFTLRDGFVDTSSSGDRGEQRGGGFYGNSAGETTNTHLLDCVITNCAAYRGGAVYAASMERCRISDCTAGNGVCRYVRMYSCIVDHLTPATGFSGQNNAYGQCFNCTFVGRSTDECVMIPGGSDVISNCIIMTTKELTKAKTNVGRTIAWDVPSCATPGVEKTNPYLANLLTDNYRPTDVSPALGYGEMWDIPKVNPLDYAGNPFRIAANGRIAAGACQEPVPAITIPKPAFGTLSPCEYAGAEPDGTLTLTYAETRRRHLLGYAVNGVMTNAPGSGSVVFRPTAEDLAAGLTIAPVFSTNWYVNANADSTKGVVGNDANDGFTPETPWETLAYASTNDLVQPYDTIHAAPGVYDKGVADSCRRARLRAYVTLLADEGPEKTLIVGAPAHPDGATESARMGGRGEGSVACVYMPWDGSHLKGFTLTGGYTANANAEDLDDCGGAVYMARAANDGVSTVTDCIISNNCSGRSAAYQGRYVNCRFIDNYALYNTPVTRGSRLVNCIIDRNRGSTTLMGVVAVNSVIGDGNLNAAGTEEESVAYSSLVMTNCAVLGNGATGSGSSADHCFIRSDRVGAKLVVTDCNTSCASLAEMGLGADFRPLSKEALVVDAGIGDLSADHTSDTDLAGGQRIYNAHIDVGPCEYDWRGIYAATLGAGVTVTAASPDVTGTAAAVVLPAGATLDVDWPNAYGKPKKTYFSATVDVDTTLDVVRNGVPLVALDAGRHDYRYRSDENADVLSFMATGIGSVVLSEFVRGKGLLLFVR